MIDYFDEPIIDINAGKFHNLFLTKSGRLYGLGFNRFGQLGLNNSMYLHAEYSTEIFTDNIQIDQISTGAHHTLILSKSGELYGFGARKNGQMDGQLSQAREE